MRITNKIIQNNSLTNINTNKVLQDSLSTQISSKKKISRPSEDPIVALRSLRLRTSVNQTSQYVDKNVEDAKSWLKVTEDSIDTLSGIITDIRKQYVKGTQDTLKASDRKIIVESLESFAAEVYNTGNADFAGRSVFTGYRTESTLTFSKQSSLKYEIEESNESAKLDVKSYVHTGDTENDVYKTEITRIRLSYKPLSGDASDKFTLEINGTAEAVETMALKDEPYAYVHDNPDKIVFVPESGEILVGSARGDKDSITSYNITYTKEGFEKGELRPEHYFNCKNVTEDIEYTSHNGDIYYNVGVNQSLKINTNASDCFNHDIVRDIDDVITALKKFDDLEERIAALEKEYASYTDAQAADKKIAKDKLDAAKKAMTFAKEDLHTTLSKSITFADNYLDKNDVALTNCGTRSKRLELIENRLDTQLMTLQELKSENEDADLAETAIKLSSAQYAYDASLMATAKILKESLLNYI